MGVPEGRVNIMLANNNFHGRTISFSSDPTARYGFRTFTPGFGSVPFGDRRRHRGAARTDPRGGRHHRPAAGLLAGHACAALRSQRADDLRQNAVAAVSNGLDVHVRSLGCRARHMAARHGARRSGPAVGDGRGPRDPRRAAPWRTAARRSAATRCPGRWAPLGVDRALDLVARQQVRGATGRFPRGDHPAIARARSAARVQGAGCPVTPNLSVVACGYSLASLHWYMWIAFSGWVAMALIFYLLWGRRHSALNHEAFSQPREVS